MPSKEHWAKAVREAFGKVPSLVAKIGPPVLAALLGLLSSVIIARGFGATGRGIYAIGITWMMTVGQVASMGLGDALAVSLRRYGQPARPRVFIVVCWILTGLLLLGVYGAGFTSILVAIGSLTSGILLQATSFTLAAGSRAKWVIVLLVQPTSVLIASVFASLKGLTIDVVLLAYVIAPILAAVLFISDLRSPVGPPSLSMHGPYSGVLRIGLQRQLTVTLSFLVRSVDILALGALYGPESAGVYAVARSLFNLCLLAPQALSGYILRAELGGTMLQKWRPFVGMSLWTLPGVLFLAAFGWILVPSVWGQEFAFAYEVFLVLTLGCIASGGARGLLAWRSARDLQGKVSKRYLMLSLPLVALIVLATALGGMLGAAAATSLSSVILLLAAWVRVEGESAN